MKKITQTLPLALACFTMGVASLAAQSPEPRRATFEVRHDFKVTVPEGARRVRIWLTLPQADPLQEVRGLAIQAPVPHRFTTDSAGNEMVFIELLNPSVREMAILQTFTLTRQEQISGVDAGKARPLTESERRQFATHLQPNEHVIIDDRIRQLSAEIIAGETNPVRAARKLYDWVLQNIEYWVKDPLHKKASPVGSTEYCLDTRTGNCTDFHSLWTSLARAGGLPTRLVYGSFLKAELDGLDADQSYHCWPEFFVPGFGWVPHDVAVADIFVGDFQIGPENDRLVRLTTADGYQGADPKKVEYYFGNLDERRVTWSRGRDLLLTPRQEAGPVNAMAKAYVEVDGTAHPEGAGWTRKLTYREIK